MKDTKRNLPNNMNAPNTLGLMSFERYAAPCGHPFLEKGCAYCNAMSKRTPTYVDTSDREEYLAKLKKDMEQVAADFAIKNTCPLGLQKDGTNAHNQFNPSELIKTVNTRSTSTKLPNN
jgi:hypothetical protein